jgi:LmbE family N-acetylglucosaminyl deacetylase
VPRDFDPQRLSTSYSDPGEISHRIDVSGFLDAKRAAMRAHASQAGGGSTVRTLAFLLRLPRPLYRRVFGTEWFVEVGPDRRVQDPATSVGQAAVGATPSASSEVE